MITIDPETTRDIEKQLSERGVRMLDAPVAIDNSFSKPDCFCARSILFLWLRERCIPKRWISDA